MNIINNVRYGDTWKKGTKLLAHDTGLSPFIGDHLRIVFLRFRECSSKAKCNYCMSGDRSIITATGTEKCAGHNGKWEWREE